MFEMLSNTQRIIVFDKKGKIIVRACPGSGKTFSVAARLAHRVKSWKNPFAGIATLSFTNVAWKEIDHNLNGFGINQLDYPHFLGTIDSFINRNIFLPYGHLLMQCSRRPTMVGIPHSAWTVKKFDKDYDQYFDIVSFGLNEELTYPKIPSLFFFNYSQILLKNGFESKHAEKLRASKIKYWKLGYANQHDANYFALKILKKFPKIAQSIIWRFPEIILDEAQDTNEIQMEILDTLCDYGLNELLLVGDPDQAIFEWNNAKPELFKQKENDWKDNLIFLNENRRSSQVICNCTFHLSTLNVVSTAVNDSVKNHDCLPEIVKYDIGNIQNVIGKFIEKCRYYNIEIKPKNLAIIARSKSFINNILGKPPLLRNDWGNELKFTYSFIHACYLYTNGFYKEAFKSIELLLYRKKFNVENVTNQDLCKYIDDKGFVSHRKELHRLLTQFPPAEGPIGRWIDQANAILSNLPLKLSMLQNAKDILIDTLFSKSDEISHTDEYTIGTVHSVKGETFEAVLLFLKKGGIGKFYKTMLHQSITVEEEEELRIVYVGLTRPKKLLMVAVPDEENKKLWEVKLLSE